MKHYVYIVECNDSSFYTGYTLNIEKRVFEHNSSSRGAKSIKGRLPVKLVFLQEFSTRVEALMAERQIKGWSRRKKEALIVGDWDTIVAFSNHKQRIDR